MSKLWSILVNIDYEIYSVSFIYAKFILKSLQSKNEKKKKLKKSTFNLHIFSKSSKVHECLQISKSINNSVFKATFKKQLKISQLL